MTDKVFLRYQKTSQAAGFGIDLSSIVGAVYISLGRGAVSRIVGLSQQALAFL